MSENNPNIPKHHDDSIDQQANEWTNLERTDWDHRAIAAKILNNIDFAKRYEVVDSSFLKAREAKQKLAGKNQERYIDAYLTRLDHIINKHGNRVEQLLWQRSLEKLIIEPENIPESYWQSQETILRNETGRSLALNDYEKEHLTHNIQKLQRESLESWTNYLGSEASPYPLWFKVFAWDGLSKMGVFDKEKGHFAKRDKTTTAPYPKCNAEVLGKVYGAMDRAYKLEQSSSNLGNNEQKLLELAKSSNFNKLYSTALLETKTIVKTPEKAEDIRGEWRVYLPQEEEALAEAASGTGWCIATPEVGRSYLRYGKYRHNNNGNNDKYYNKDNHAKFILFHLEDPTTGLISDTASASVRLNLEGKVAEISGLGDRQAIEDALIPTVEAKVRSLNGGEDFLQAFADKKELIRLDHKMQAGETEFSQEDINFIFEQDRKIQNLNTFKTDPRIKKLKAYVLENHNLPNLKVRGDLKLAFTKITKLPEGLKVGGTLDLSNTEITELPEGLEVGEDLELAFTKINKLPEDLEVKGSLNLSGTEITGLPAGLKVGGNLNLNTEITELPEGLKVGGTLDLSNLGITKISEGLEVGGTLDLSNTEITELPEGLKVGWSLYLRGTKITKLPEGLKVGAKLDLSNTEITIFCKLGEEEASRPVTVPVWLNEVWMRPVPGTTSSGRASTYVLFSLAISRFSRISSMTSCVPVISSNTSAAVE